MLAANRVVVTGMGVLAANGIGLDAYWSTLLAGKSGIGPITLFDASDFPNAMAGEVKGFDPQEYIPQLKTHRLARHTQLALAAAAMAIDDAGGRELFQRAAEPTPIVMGVSTSSFDLIQLGLDRIRSKGATYATPYVISSAGPQAVACEIAKAFEIPAKILTISTTCAAGLDAIASAFELVRSGKSDLAIAGGADAPIAISPYANFVAASLVSKKHTEPHKASRPFDRDRDGGVLAEGAGVVILENLEHALARGRRPYLEVTASGLCFDKQPKIPASGLDESMSLAMHNAGRRPGDIDHVCAHAPSDPFLDRIEISAIKNALGDDAQNATVSSIKGVTGNPLAAAGPLQVIACGMAMKHAKIYPTANYEHPDPDCDLDIPDKPRHAKIQRAIVNAHGIGGGNSTLLVDNAESI